MKIQREAWVVVAVVAFLLSWLIDRLSGPILIVIGNPIAFLSSRVLLNKYPFTATAIVIRTFALFVSSMLVLSLIPRKYFLKAITLFFVGMLGEFYAIQQLATGFHLTTIQWTLAIAYSALSLVLGIVAMVLMGIWASFNKEKVTDPNEKADDEEESVLKPPTEE